MLSLLSYISKKNAEKFYFAAFLGDAENSVACEKQEICMKSLNIYCKSTKVFEMLCVFNGKVVKCVYI